ncbi:MAG: sulfatase-like hydrolase/transferase, partial [Verrucomicrobiia bacterium]
MNTLSIRKLTTILIVTFASVAIVQGARTSDKPNVIIFYVDDMGYADPSCFGNPDMETPNIDRFATEGLKLTNYYSNSPICSSSRVALNTGQAPGRHKVWAHFASKKQNATRNMADFLDPNVQTMAKSFKANGYATAHFGKWHMGGGRDVVAPYPQAYGFEESLVSFEGLGDRLLWDKKGLNGQSAKLERGNISYVKKHETTGIYVDRAIDFMKRSKDEPFYLHVFPNDVHDRHEPDEEWMAKYEKYSSNP